MESLKRVAIQMSVATPVTYPMETIKGITMQLRTIAPAIFQILIYEDDGILYFHLGAILPLFPGLQLDVLEVFCGTRASPYSCDHTTDCFGSLTRGRWLSTTLNEGQRGRGRPGVLQTVY